MRTLARIVKFSFQSFWRNLWLSLVTLTIFVLTLMTVNAVILVNVLTDGAIKTVEDRVQVAVYFEPGTSEDMQQYVRGYLLGLAQVKTIDAISADEALANFRERHANDPTVLSALDEVGGNPFGDAVLISAQSPEDFSFILEAVRRDEFVDVIKDTDYTDYQEVITRLSAIAERLRLAGFALAGFFAFISILIIFNAIRIAIYVHRDEIAIMKLVGAHDWFVRAPFLLEVLMLSAIATGIMVGLVMGATRALEVPLVRYFGNADVSLWTYFQEHGVEVFGLEFVALAVLSLATTYIAMRKHLRV